jgi:hypothetical protein
VIEHTRIGWAALSGQLNSADIKISSRLGEQIRVRTQTALYRFGNPGLLNPRAVAGFQNTIQIHLAQTPIIENATDLHLRHAFDAHRTQGPVLREAKQVMIQGIFRGNAPCDPHHIRKVPKTEVDGIRAGCIRGFRTGPREGLCNIGLTQTPEGRTPTSLVTHLSAPQGGGFRKSRGLTRELKARENVNRTKRIRPSIELGSQIMLQLHLARPR